MNKQKNINENQETFINKDVSLEQFDTMIQNRIKSEYKNVSPSDDSTMRIKVNVREALEGKSVQNPWAKYYRVAAVIVVALLLTINASSIRAIAVNFWQRFFDTFQERYERRTSDYVIDLDLEFEIDNTRVCVSQYVVSEDGIEFKIEKPKESDVEIYGCYFDTSWKGSANVNYFIWPHIEDYYIGMSYYEGIDFTSQGDKIDGMLYLLYSSQESEVKVISKEMTLDLTNIYQGEKITNKELVDTENFTIQSISMGTWYMKVTYRKKEVWENNNLLVIEQNGDMVVSLNTMMDGSIVEEYYPMPDDFGAKLEFSMAEIVEMEDYSESDTNIRKIGESKEIDISEYFDKTE